MNEPLTNPAKKHPQWYNETIRLTKEQTQEPLLVLDDFFQCYHLNETRQILWEWLKEVVSSSRSVSIDGHDRRNHIYFYEKVEEMIDAAFVIRNRDKQISFEFVEEKMILNKPKQLIEFVNDAPVYVIREVYKEESLACISSHLQNWLQIALADESSIYEVEEQRNQLIAFHDELQSFIEALFVFCSTDYTKNEKISTSKIGQLNQDQIVNPMPIIAAFFDKFSIVYIERELNDWLESGVGYTGTYPDSMSELQALHTYRSVLCLIKSAHRLIRNPGLSKSLNVLLLSNA